MKNNFNTGEIYHIFNHGVEIRNLFSDVSDIDRFQQSLVEFNTIEPIGSIYENSFINKHNQLGSFASKLESKDKRLVNIIAYCLNPNHYHLILEQLVDNGISKFMHRVGGGYTKYLNIKLKRRGSLFQGVFKSKHVNEDGYLLHLSVYVNLNDRVHGLDTIEQLSLGSEASKLIKSRSSWREYIENIEGICDKSIILEQFNNSRSDYKKFAEENLQNILNNRKELDFNH